MEPKGDADRTSYGAEHFHALDSLRGLAALIVMGLHFPSLNALINNSFFHHGWMFVDFFFVLSGFVIAASYGSRLEVGYSVVRFMFLRWGRIYPTHLAVLLFTVFGQVAIGLSGLEGSSEILEQVFSWHSLVGLLQSLSLTWALAFDEPGDWIGTSWSISVEFWMYLVAALIYRFSRGRARSFFFLLVAVCATLLLTSGDHNLLRIDQWSLVRGLFSFSLGVVCYHGRSDVSKVLRIDRSNNIWNVLEVTCIIAMVAAVSLAGDGLFSLLLPCLFVVAVLVFSHGRGFISAMLNMSGPRFLGRISYPLYLIHYYLIFRLLNVAQVIERKFSLDVISTRDGHDYFSESSVAGNAFALFSAMVVILVAAVLHYVVEEPGRLWSRSLAKSRKLSGLSR